MPRAVTFETPTNPTQFGPEQIRPRVLLGLAITSLGRWFAAHLVPYSRLLNDYRTGFVFTTVQLDNALPDLRFVDADWLAITSRVRVSSSAKYLQLTVDIHSRLHTQESATRRVASFQADLRVVTIVETDALTGIPGILPDPLYARFMPEEIYQPDRTAITRAATPPAGKEIFNDDGQDIILCRSHCEVADQWSFIEVLELMTTARERLFLQSTVPAAVGRLAVAQPVRNIVGVFHRSMYVFDTCRTTTRVLACPAEDSPLTFVYSLHDPTRPGTCVTAWETVSLPDGDTDLWRNGSAPTRTGAV
ncbi:MAG: putative thioesterase [Propionibacteriaceae bacterium]|nr:putative thioesterase [Propionibacteriaceae bacterium]